MISTWTTFEVVLRGLDGQLDPQQRPFSKGLADGGDDLKTAVQKMLLVQHHGWPDARLKLKGKGKSGPLIDRADDQTPEIWILKCKPSCWRLYFCVYQTNRRIVYLYAKCKKKQKREPEDSVRARNRLASLSAGGSGIAEFRFPDDRAL